VYDAVQPVNVALAARCLLESGAEAMPYASSAARTICWRDWAASPCTCAAGLRPGCCWAGWATHASRSRPVNGVKVILPPMVEIAGGEAKIGSDDDDDLD
jgi:hypothetical protein